MVVGWRGDENGHLRNSSLEKKWVYYLDEERNWKKARLHTDWLMFQTSLQEGVSTVGEAEEAERFRCHLHHESHRHTQQPGNGPTHVCIFSAFLSFSLFLRSYLFLSSSFFFFFFFSSLFAPLIHFIVCKNVIVCVCVCVIVCICMCVIVCVHAVV